MRLTNDHRYKVATKVTMEIYESKVKNLILLIREDATNVYKNSLDKDYLKMAPKIDKDKTSKYQYFSYRDSVQIDGISSHCSINKFSENEYNEYGSIKSYAVNPLRSYLYTFHTDNYTNKKIVKKYNTLKNQIIFLTENVINPACGYHHIKNINWDSTIKLIKDLSVILNECEKLFSEIYEFLLQFSTYAKVYKEWPDIDRYITLVIPSLDKKMSTALVKSGNTLRNSINKARAASIGV